MTPASPCADCGTATTPCTGRRGCRHMGRWEWYMVRFIGIAARNPRWFGACMRAGGEMLAGRITVDEFEDRLKLAQYKYGVNWHRFSE